MHHDKRQNFTTVTWPHRRRKQLKLGGGKFFICPHFSLVPLHFSYKGIQLMIFLSKQVSNMSWSRIWINTVAKTSIVMPNAFNLTPKVTTVIVKQARSETCIYNSTMVVCTSPTHHIRHNTSLRSTTLQPLPELWLFSERTTLRSLYAIGRPSVCLLSVGCLSVVCDVGAPYSGGWTFLQFFSPYDSSGTLLFWCQKSLVGDAPFPLKFAFKVTHPLSNSEISTNIGS